MIASSLAHYGLLGSSKWMLLHNVDLSKIPAQRLTSLASRVKNLVNIRNASCCDLVSLFASLKRGLQSLGREVTQGLVQEGMALGFKNVKQDYELTLDIKALTEYSGQGVCSIKTQCRPEDLGQEQKLES